MKKFIVCTCVSFLVIACGNGSSGERKDGYSQKPVDPGDSLFEEVMDGHDTAMAKMGRLRRYRKDVAAKLDSLEKKGSNASETLKSSLKELGAELQRAEDGMNKWMEDFNIDSAKEGVERRITYLRKEKIKVDDVKEKIFETLKKADSLLKK